MEDLVEQSVASKMEEVSTLLKREWRLFIGNGRSEIQSLIHTLQSLNDFLIAADSKTVEKLTRESVRSWLDEPKEHSEEFNTHVEENSVVKLSKLLQEHRLISFIRGAGERFYKLNGIRKLASSEAQTTKAFPSHKLLHSSVEEYHEAAAKDVMTWVTDGEPARSVLSIVGPSGIGKTALAWKVYTSDVVRDHFNCVCWVDVSASYKTKHLQEFVIKQIKAVQDGAPVHDGMRLIDLVGTLSHSLHAKRYLFVYDNVSQEDLWGFMKCGLPDNGKASRVIITTTSDAVVSSCNEAAHDQVRKLRPLSHSESFELFRRIVFQNEPEQNCPLELEPLSQEILRLCRGFPLPIVGISAFLSKKEKRISEWQSVCRTLKLKIKTNLLPPTLIHVLALSYYDLPDYLRPCFLYFSIFPEDYLVPTEKLFKLWIAEGFVEEKVGKTLEEVAEEYLNELILRDLVQPCLGIHELDQFCRVDRIMYRFAQLKANEFNFSNVWDGKFSRFRRSHRVSVYNVGNVYDTIKDNKTRSVFLFNVRSLPVFFLATLFQYCDFLTVLDFEDCPVENLPEELGDLFHLKYLGLENTLVSRLPKSLHKLQNLQTLRLRNTLLTELPVEINKLKNLRHLLVGFYFNGSSEGSNKGLRVTEGIGGLANLHTLTTLQVHQSFPGIIEDVMKLHKLRRLGVSGVTMHVSTALCRCIDELGYLESLVLRTTNNKETLNLQGISSKLDHLKHLVLAGQLNELPEWIFHLQNLSVLCLHHSGLMKDPLQHISHLPNLASLWLYSAYDGEKLHFEGGGFVRLKLLDIRELHGLKVLEIEDGALPLLEELRIGSSPYLNEVPVDILHLRNLKILSIFDMQGEFVLGMQPDDGSDYWKVEHVSDVLFCYKDQGRSYKLFKLGDSDLLDHLQGLATDTNVFQPHQLDDVLHNTTRTWSFSSGFYTDDLEE